MRFTVKIYGYDGLAKVVHTCEGERSDVCQLVADEPGAAYAVVTDERGRVESIAKGTAFVTVDGRPRKTAPVMKYSPAQKARAVRAPRRWYGAAIAG